MTDTERQFRNVAYRIIDQHVTAIAFPSKLADAIEAALTTARADGYAAGVAASATKLKAYRPEQWMSADRSSAVNSQRAMVTDIGALGGKNE